MLIHFHRAETPGSEPSALHRITVVVAEGQPRLAGQLADVLRRDARIEVLEVVTSVSETIASTEALVPDVVLMGDFPHAELESATRAIESIRTVAVVILVRPGRQETLGPGVRGAGFLLWNGTAEQVLSGFFEVASLAAALRRGAADRGG